MVGEPHAAAVEPDEERRLRAKDADAGDMVCDVSLDEEDVLLDIPQHLASPLLAVTEGGYGGYGGEERGLAKLVGRQPAVEAFAQAAVGDDAV